MLHTLNFSIYLKANLYNLREIFNKVLQQSSTHLTKDFHFKGVESYPIPPHGTPWQAEGLHSLLKGSIGGSCHICLNTLVQLP